MVKHSSHLSPPGLSMLGIARMVIAMLAPSPYQTRDRALGHVDGNNSNDLDLADRAPTARRLSACWYSFRLGGRPRVMLLNASAQFVAVFD